MAVLSAAAAVRTVIPLVTLISLGYAFFAFQYSWYLFPGSTTKELWAEFVALLCGRDYAFGKGSVYKQSTATYQRAYVLMFVHTTLGAIILAIGPFQFIQQLRRWKLDVHRWAGRVYAGLQAIFLPCQAAYLLYTNPHDYYTGVPFAFALWGLWGLTTASLFMAVVTIRTKDVRQHSAWMALNFAMICSAPSLRIIWILGAWACPSCTMADVNVPGASFPLPVLIYLAAAYIAGRENCGTAADATTGIEHPPSDSSTNLIAVFATIGSFFVANETFFRLMDSDWFDIYSYITPKAELAESIAVFRTHWFFAILYVFCVSVAMIVGVVYVGDVIRIPIGVVEAFPSFSSEDSSHKGDVIDIDSEMDSETPRPTTSGSGMPASMSTPHLRSIVFGEEDYGVEERDFPPMPTVWPSPITLRNGEAKITSFFVPHTRPMRLGLIYYVVVFLAGVGAMGWFVALDRGVEAYRGYAATFWVSWVIVWWILTAIAFFSAASNSARHVEWLLHSVGCALVPTTQVVFFLLFSPLTNHRGVYVGSTTIAFGLNAFLVYTYIAMKRYSTKSLLRYSDVWLEPIGCACCIPKPPPEDEGDAYDSAESSTQTTGLLSRSRSSNRPRPLPSDLLSSGTGTRPSSSY